MHTSLAEIRNLTRHFLTPNEDAVRLKVPALRDSEAAHVEGTSRRSGLNQLVQGSPLRTSKQDALINIIDRNPRADAARSPYTFVLLILQHFGKFQVNGRDKSLARPATDFCKWRFCNEWGFINPAVVERKTLVLFELLGLSIYIF